MIAWGECWLSTPVSCDHLIVHLNCWSVKTFSHFWGFCPLWFWSYFGFRNVVLLSSFVFVWPPTWSHIPVNNLRWQMSVLRQSNVSSTLNWRWTDNRLTSADLDCLLGWLECWLPTPISCDHGIVHLDCWSIKIFSQFWRFCPLWLWSFAAFALWCFCPILFFSVLPRDRMTRMLIIHTCIMWSWDCTPWLLEY